MREFGGVENRIEGSTVHGDVFQVGRDLTVVQRPAAVAAAPVWPVVVGIIPPEAGAFQPRDALQQRIDDARARHHEGGPGTPAVQVLAGGGGVGKTQLAARLARRAVRRGTDLVVWADAAEPTGVLAAYAEAAALVRAPGVTGRGDDVQRDAQRFLAWLAVTDRSWLVVLDDVTDFAPGPLWPATDRGGTGQVIATSRHRGATATGAGRTLVEVDAYGPAESAAYLAERLSRAGQPQLLDDSGPDLAAELGHLPLALAHASAYLLNTRRTSTDYLHRLRARTRTLDALMRPRDDTDGYHRPVTASLLLALDAVEQEEPAGLARPALRLAAVLEPSGQPMELWTSPPVLAHLGAHRSGGAQPDGDDVLDVLAALYNYNLLTTADPGPRGVTLHPLTARAVLDITPEAQRPYGVAADALVALWPQNDHTDRELVGALQAGATALWACAGDRLWEAGGGAHHVLGRAGNSLLAHGLHRAATDYFTRAVAVGRRVLGEDHPDTIGAGACLVIAHNRGGRFLEAVTLGEQVLASYRRVLGPEHPHTLGVRSNLALAHGQAGHTREAVALHEQLLADLERLFGPDDPHSIAARANLAHAYHRAGRTSEAAAMGEQALADQERVLGPDHPDTLSARNNLAGGYRASGRKREAVALGEEVLAGRERVLGPDHPDTLGARNNLAAFYGDVGRTADAISLAGHVLADRERLLGPDHPDTLTTCNNLALLHRQAWHLDEAVALMERVVRESRRVLGERHPSTSTRRISLGNVLQDRGCSRLSADPAAALRDARAAAEVLAPGPGDDPDRYRTPLAGALRLAADALDAAGRPEEAAEQRERARALRQGARERRAPEK
ncbi:tetratricopeptide repeat protein [Kitasatospora sp. NPDC048722]|uniref:tetratricopeptide repeat protein n=1 Tax=Kitasatospora sp. NPDC048722 TaxID=3155639 RepID=UPI0034031C5F